MKKDERHGMTALRVAARYMATLSAPEGSTRAVKTRDVLDDLVSATGAVLKWLRLNPKNATPELQNEMRTLLKSIVRVRTLAGVRGGSEELWEEFNPSTESSEN